jgi:hypothetical protein
MPSQFFLICKKEQALYTASMCFSRNIVSTNISTSRIFRYEYGNMPLSFTNLCAFQFDSISKINIFALLTTELEGTPSANVESCIFVW